MISIKLFIEVIIFSKLIYKSLLYTKDIDAFSAIFAENLFFFFVFSFLKCFQRKLSLFFCDFFLWYYTRKFFPNL